jgi:glycosyltransferase involved in cell wall biosynthesis
VNRLVPYMSVIVCSYNGEHVIGRAIESLLAQNYPKNRFEIIVVDDGSTDQTSHIIQKYPVKYVRHVVNQGIAAARW